MSATDEARELSELTGAAVEAHPYTLGYWARVACKPRPSRKGQRQEGWDQANLELERERLRQVGRERLPLVNVPTDAPWHMTAGMFALLSEQGETAIVSADNYRYRVARRKGAYERVYVVDEALVPEPEAEHA